MLYASKINISFVYVNFIEKQKYPGLKISLMDILFAFYHNDLASMMRNQNWKSKILFQITLWLLLLLLLCADNTIMTLRLDMVTKIGHGLEVLIFEGRARFYNARWKYLQMNLNAFSGVISFTV